MASEKGPKLKRRYLLIVVGLAVFLVYLYLFVPLGDLIETVKRLNPLYFLLAFFALLASVALYSVVWQRLLGLLSVKTSFLKAFQFVWVENFVDLVIPGEPVSGEVSRIYLMSKDAGGDYGKVVASAVGQRIATTCVTAAGLLVSIVYFALTSRPPLFVLAFAIVILLGDAVVIGLLFYLASRKRSTRRLANWLFNLITRVSRGRWKLEQARERVTKALDIFHEGILTLGAHRKSLVLPMVLTAFSWLLDMSIALLVFLSLGSAGTAISISAIIIVYSISGAIQYLPIGVIPGEVGLAEIIMTTLYALLGSPQFLVVFAVATVLIRVLTFWARLLIGGIVVQFTAIKNLMPSPTSS
ncbi:MAG: flippase-like domain-containing protein [Candidatus Bathyarchaeia archaeon]|jgi:uncharacterized protein (TIRG00374 family)